MIFRIAQKEILETVRDGRFRTMAVTVVGLLTISLILGWKSYSDVNRQHETGRRATRQNWISQGVKNPHSAAHYGVYAFKPRTSLSFIDTGTDPYTGVAVWLEAHKQDDFKYKPAQDASTLSRFGELTAATILQILIPLLIILLSFSAFAGEREGGTLKQLLSLGVKKNDLALGKALGISAALGAVLIPAALLGAALLVGFGEPGAFLDTADRILLLACLYLLYFVVFLGLSLAVSASARSGRMALLLLLTFWIVNSLIAPRAVSDVARRMYPTPSAFTFTETLEHDLASGVSGNSSAEKRAAELRRRVMAQYGVEDIKKLPISFLGISLQQGEEDGDKVFDLRYGELWNLFERQNRMRQASSVFAPMLAMRSLSMALAGTDFEQHRQFATAAERYRRFFIKKINDDITTHATSREVYTRGNDLWQSIPEFRYTAPGLGFALNQQKLPIVLLGCWALAAILAAYWTTRRMEAL